MDSEDEVYLEEERARRVGMSIQEVRDSYTPPAFPELRMYQLEEYIAVTKVYLPYARRLDAFAEDVVRRRQYGLRGIPYHVMRFCDTIKGFHRGSVDLCGRHEARYASAHKRWLVFHVEVKNLLKHCTQSWQTVMGPDGKLVRNRNGKPKREQVLVIKPASVQMEFEQRWRFRLRDPALLGELCEEVASCITQHPAPILQKIRLVDLPAELLYPIFELSGNLDIHTLGATCKLLRDASLPYIYKVRSLDMKGMGEVDWSLTRLPPSKDMAPLLVRSAKVSREGFIQEAEFLRSRKDIAERIEKFRVGCWPDIMLAHAYPDHYQRRLTFRFSLSRALGDVLPSLKNVRWMFLSYVVITSALAQTLVSLPQLSTLILHHCKVTSKFRRVKTTSESVTRLVVQTREYRRAHVVWRLAPFFTCLKDIHVLGSDERDPFPFAGPLSGFSSPIMENLTHFRVSNLTNAEWIRLRGILAGVQVNGTPLRLTHFKLTALDPFDRGFLFDLIAGLGTAPLEYLILDGIHYAGIDFFDCIRTAFPCLASLTLNYRGNHEQWKSKLTRWPLPSWEYAQAIAHFPNLRHFGWNYAVEAIAYPRALTSFESDYADGPIDDDHAESEAPYLRLLFAQTCPNMRSFSAGHGTVVFFERRGAVVDIKDDNDVESFRYALQQNPRQDDLDFVWR